MKRWFVQYKNLILAVIALVVIFVVGWVILDKVMSFPYDEQNITTILN